MKRYLAAAFLFAAAGARAEESDALESKLRMESIAEGNPFAVTPHRPSYFLPYTYQAGPTRGVPGRRSPQNAEAKFQLSFRVPLWEEFGGRSIKLYAAYTQLSFWQVYNHGDSAAFRENNYEPELFLAFFGRRPMLGFDGRVLMVGFDHQSNGRGYQDRSRSWNRLYAEGVLTRGNLVVSLRPWWRVPEPHAEDDNPQMDKYYGHGELRLRYKRGTQVWSALWRNNLRVPNNKGAVQLGWSGALVKQLRWYVQYFNGYGESLVDYDHPDQRIGAGVLLGEWL